MLKKIDILLILAVVGACADPKDEEPDPAEQAPEPIGPELIRVVGGWNWCTGGAHLYRNGRAIQSQCFGESGDFRYENRGTLTAEAAETLDAEIAAADLSDTEPVNHEGSCGTPDSQSALETLWVGDQSISYELGCLIQGIVPLYEHVHAIWRESWDCGEEAPVLLESIEPGCRIYWP